MDIDLILSWIFLDLILLKYNNHSEAVFILVCSIKLIFIFLSSGDRLQLEYIYRLLQTLSKKLDILPDTIS